MINEKRLEELNQDSKVELTSEEIMLAKKIFDAAIKTLKSTDSGNYGGYVRNRIKIRLAEMFDDEVETNL